MTDDRDEPRAPENGAGEEDEPASLVLYHARRLDDPTGREAAYRFFYDTYYDRLCGFFSRQRVGPEKARELTQDTFLRVFRGRGEFHSGEEFEAWLFRIARNVHLNHERKRRARKRQGTEQSLERWAEQHGSGIPERPGHETTSPLQAYLDHERQVVLAEALTRLPAKMRRCFVLRYNRGLSYEEIAEELGVSLGTVKAHLHQAKRRLIEELGEYRERFDLSQDTSTES